jgi:stage V sporulation protein R
MASVQLNTLPEELAEVQRRIEGYARGHGLDFFETIFELVDADQLNAIAAYGGFPTRYPHWRFGMEYEQLSKGYNYGLQKIYELVINNNPCYAYLMKSNELTDQKLVMAHVYGHCDFFKNNYWFSQTSRKMMDEMANHGNRIRKYMDRFGVEEVENFIDACLSIEDLIDIYSPHIQRYEHKDRYQFTPATEDESNRGPNKFDAKEYMDRFINPPNVLAAEAQRLRREEIPQRAGTGRHAFHSGACTTEGLAGRCAVDYPGRGLLFCTSRADENYERRLGQLLAQHDHDAARSGGRRRN